jgi:hypothetical protein
LSQGVFVFSFIGVFAFAVAVVSGIHLGLLSALEVSRFWARCLLGPDGDELGLLSKARPMTAKPLNAVTRIRDCSTLTTLT